VKETAHNSRFDSIALQVPVIISAIAFSLLITGSPVYAYMVSSERYAIIVQNIGPNLAMDFRRLLIEDGGIEESNILCYGNDKPFADLCAGKPTPDEFSGGFAEIGENISAGDTIILLFACHMQKGYLINNSLPYNELNTMLSSIPDDATVIVIIEGCYAASALPVLGAADIVYASAGPDEPCYGGWLRFFLDALDRDDDAFKTADMDRNGFVSFGEAFDYAADENRLKEWYAQLSRDVWPPADFYPTPCRTDAGIQYNFFLNPYAPTPF
jgi:hypothetical protein